jgi:hypothetical protein
MITEREKNPTHLQFVGLGHCDRTNQVITLSVIPLSSFNCNVMLDHIKKVSQARKLLNKICLPGRRRGDRSCSHQDWTHERLDRNRFGHWPGNGGTCFATKKLFQQM